MPSHFCWHEVRTPDRQAARAFYGALFGWKFTDQDMGPAGVYTDIAVGPRSIGGVCDVPKGAPPHWISYVATDGADGAAERAKRAGGKVLVPPTDIPGIGRFAVVQDPQGAVVCPWQSLKPSPADEGFAPGAFCWNELVTADVDGAKRFYGEVFGWTTSDVPGRYGTYTLIQSEGKGVGGILSKPPQAPGPASWVGYVLTTDVDASAAAVTKLGGRIWQPATDIDGVGRFAVCADPAGATFALFKPVAGRS